MCLEKSTLIQYRLVLRGRDEVERAFKVSSGGHRGKDIHAWNLSSHYIIYRGTLFTGSVMCFLSAWVLHIILAADRIHSSHAN